MLCNKRPKFTLLAHNMAAQNIQLKELKIRDVINEKRREWEIFFFFFCFTTESNLTHYGNCSMDGSLCDLNPQTWQTRCISPLTQGTEPPNLARSYCMELYA